MNSIRSLLLAAALLFTLTACGTPSVSSSVDVPSSVKSETVLSSVPSSSSSEKAMSSAVSSSKSSETASSAVSSSQGGETSASSLSASPSSSKTEEPSSASSPESSTASSSAVSPETEKPRKILVAYFSATGNTRRIAEYIAAETGGELYEIVPAQPYTPEDLDYTTDCRANREMNDPASRPAISGQLEGMEEYSLVFLGYPIWWGEAPRILSTFVEQHDLSGKTVVTFSTSGGSGHDDRSLSALVSGANWITGTRFSGSASQSDAAAWLSRLGVNLT